MTKQQALERRGGHQQTLTLAEIDKTYPAERYNLLTPRTVTSRPPEATQVTVSQVVLDAKPEHGDVYPQQGGKLAPTKAALNKIAAAAGISWDASRRVDDRKHPHYCEWEVVGSMLMPDGTVRRESACKTVDMREDNGADGRGGDLQQIISTAKNKDRDPTSEILAVRQHIASHAETKAKLRCIRALLGLQTAYNAGDLKKPFVVVKLSPDPHHPAVQGAVMDRFFGASQSLYGGGKVIDSTEADALGAQPEGDGDEAVEDAGALPSSAASDDDPPMDEALPFEAIEERITAAWRRAKAAGFARDKWTAFVRANTGGKGYRELGDAELVGVDRAVEAFLANAEAES
jgi:hypothetical protein